MSFVKRLTPILVSAFVLVSLSPGPAQATSQEAFICSLKEGKTVEDLMKVAAEFAKAAEGLEGGKDYKAWILTPIASQDLDTVVWIGQMPDFTSLAAFNDTYGASEVSEKLDAMFENVSDCESRSFWQVHDVK